MLKRIKEIFEYKEMIKNLIKRELRGRYQKSMLGVLWTMLYPFFQTLIFTIVFTFIIQNNIENYAVHFIVALIPWTFFSESMSTGAISMVQNADMIKKIYFPREVLVISSVTSKFVNMLVSFIIIFIFIIIFKIPINLLAITTLPIIVIIEYILITGFVLIISSMCVYFRDMEYITGIVLQVWIWATPIMYSINNVKGILLKLIYLNPLTIIILSFRDVLYYSRLPNFNHLAIAFVIACVVLVIGEIVFMKLEPNFVEEL